MKLLLLALIPVAASGSTPAEVRARVDAVAAAAVARGSVSYSDLAGAFYGETFGGVLAERGGSSGLASYAPESISARTPVLVRRDQPGRGASASYGAGGILVFGGGVGGGEYLLHEAGHHVQTAGRAEQVRRVRSEAARAPSHSRSAVLAAADDRAFYAAPYLAARSSARAFVAEEDQRMAAFLAYVMHSTEWEIRMQSLNRFFWLRHGRLIGSLDDARLALDGVASESNPDVLALVRDAKELPAIFEASARLFGPAHAEAIRADFLRRSLGHL